MSAESRTASAEHDWTTAENLAAGLRDKLRIEGYGTAFRLFRDGVPIDEEAARLAIIDEITTPPVVGGYQQSLLRMTREDPGLRDRPAAVGVDQAGELVFEHGGFQRPVDPGGLVVVAGLGGIGRRKRRTRKEAEREGRLRWKLDGTRGTEEADYLAHAECCGYLVRNAAIRFNSRGRDQWGTSVTTRIGGVAPPSLRGFIDSTGEAALAAPGSRLSECADAGRGKAGIEAMYRGFARELIDFLNLESEVDIDGIARRYRRRSDSGFRPVEHWCGGREAVLRNLIGRRPDLDAREIAKRFEQGYARGG